MPSVDQPDLIDLVEHWIKNHETLGNLHTQVNIWPKAYAGWNEATAMAGKTLVLNFKDDPYTRTDSSNYIVSLNSNGHLWRWDRDCNKKVINEDLDPTDPIFFERLEVLIRKAMVMRVL